jgi:hypothetical protein
MGGSNKMKHSKMFKMLLAGVAVVAMTSSTFAAVTVPWSDSFESYTDGADIGTNAAGGWYAEAEVALATTSDNPTGYYAGYPITNDTHNVTMAFDGTVSNSITGVATEGVYVDFLVQPTFWDEDDAPAVPDNSQVAMYFDTNGYANVYHGYISVGGAETTNLWTQINCANIDSISTGDWVRVTYKMNYVDDAGAGNTFFNLYINGELATSQFAYPDMWPDEEPMFTNGTYFLNADSLTAGGSDKISSFTAKGAGTLDDFVVTDGSITPFVPFGNQYTVTTSAGVDGSIDPVGDTIVDEGDSFSATVTADMNSLIATITTNAIAITLTDSAMQVVTFDVFSDVTVAATFTNASIVSYTIAITNLNDTLGTVTPGTDTSANAGTDLTVVATPNTGYAASITVDGTPETAAIFTNIQEDHVVLVDFVLGDITSTNGVDVSSTWLGDYGLALTQANADMHWEAYLADIDPTDGSTFEIISAEVVDGTNYITWVTEGNTPDLPAFDVMATDDLMGTWAKAGEVNRTSTLTTNVFMDATKTYYQIMATDGD